MEMRTGVFIGRFQPWHEGHLACVEKILTTHDRVLIMIRSGEERDANNPFDFDEVCARIRATLIAQIDAGQIMFMRLPDPGYDLTIFYGRAVGYAIEELKMPSAIEAVSATKKRQELGLGETRPLT